MKKNTKKDKPEVSTVETVIEAESESASQGSSSVEAEVLESTPDETPVPVKKRRLTVILLITLVAIVVVAVAVYLVRPIVLTSLPTEPSSAVTSVSSSTASTAQETASDQHSDESQQSDTSSDATTDSTTHSAASTPSPSDNQETASHTAVASVVASKSNSPLPAEPSASAQNYTDESAAHDTDSAVVSDSMAHLQQQLDTLQKQLVATQARLQQLQTQLQQQHALLNQDQYILSQATYLLTTAQNALALSHNPNTAIDSLKVLLKTIQGHPAMKALGDAVKSDIVSLESAHSESLEHLYQQTQQLSEWIAKAPFITPEKEVPNQHELANEGWWKRNWNSVKNWMSEDFGGLVRVEKLSSADAALLDLNQARLLRENLQMTVTVAQQALVMNQDKIWQLSLQSVAKRLHQFFDPHNKYTQQALDLIEQLEQSQIRAKLPTLQYSLDALKHTKDLLQ